MKQLLKCPDGKLSIELDSSEIYPDDPGRGTPALVVLKQPHIRCHQTVTSSLECTSSEGEVDGFPLNQAQKAWLNKQYDYCQQWVSNSLKICPA